MIELAALYQRRWKIETAFAQLKTQLGCGLALRSKPPELVMQEFYALLMAHAAIRGLMSAAANRTDLVLGDTAYELRGEVGSTPHQSPGVKRVTVMIRGPTPLIAWSNLEIITR